MTRLWRRAAALVLALSTVIMFAAPDGASAYERLGSDSYEFKSSEISDGVLTACFWRGWPYTYRGPILAGFNWWGHRANSFGEPINLEVVSLGDCEDGTNQVANIRVDDFDPPAGNCLTYPQAKTLSPINTSDPYEQVTIEFNLDCDGLFYKGLEPPVPSGDIDLYGISAHEMGHALGLAHSSGRPQTEGYDTTPNTEQLMDWDGPGGQADGGDCDGFVSKRINTWARDDARGIRSIYPNLETSTADDWYPVNHDCVQ